jgi:HEAT repeat protein
MGDDRGGLSHRRNRLVLLIVLFLAAVPFVTYIRKVLDSGRASPLKGSRSPSANLGESAITSFDGVSTQGPLPARSQHGLLASWKEIPTEYLTLPIPIGVSDIEFKPRNHAGMLARLTWSIEIHCYAPGEVDRLIRGLAVVEVADHYIAKLSGVPSAGNVHHVNQYYMPVSFAFGGKPPLDPETCRSALLNLLAKDDMEELIQTLPSQHRCEGIENVLKCRAMAFLGGLGRDGRSSSVLKSALQDEQHARVKAAAFRALLGLGGEAEKEASAWFANQTDSELTQALLSSLAPAHWKYGVNSDPLHGAEFGSLVATTGRSLDEALLDRLAHVGDSTLSVPLAAALAGRTDNPAVKAGVIRLLQKGDAGTRLAILEVNPDLLNDPEYVSSVRWLIGNDDLRLRSRALSTYAAVPDPRVRDVVAPFLFDTDPRLALNALIAMKDCGRYDPQGSLDLIRKALGNKLNEEDTDFAITAMQTISFLEGIARDPEGFRRENEEYLKRNKKE